MLIILYCLMFAFSSEFDIFSISFYAPLYLVHVVYTKIL